MIKMPRCSNIYMTRSTAVELHVFCDASMHAYRKLALRAQKFEASLRILAGSVLRSESSYYEPTCSCNHVCARAREV